MAIAQDTFSLYRGVGYEGQQSTIDVNDVISRVVETAAIPFGRAVVRGTAANSCAPADGSQASDVIGFTVRTLAAQNNVAEVAEYDVEEVASVLRRGRMFGLCLGGASAGDTVHVVINTAGGEELGQLRGASETTNTVELTNVKWVNDVADGEIGEFQADGILA